MVANSISDNQVKGGITRGQWMTLLAAFLGWMFDGLEMGIFPLVGAPALADLLGTQDSKLIGLWFGRITAMFLIGAAAGGLVFGWLGDRIGRVRSMSISILMYSGFTGLAYFSRDAWEFAGYRFIAALGMGGEWSLGVALVMECWPADKRPLLAGAIGAASNIGFGLIAIIGYNFQVHEQSWRWVMLAGAAPALLTFFIRLFVPESERWKEATKGAVATPIREVFGPALLKTTLLAICFGSIALVGTWGSVQWIQNWVNQLTHNQEPKAKALAQIYSAYGAVIGSFFGPFLGQWFGRRPVYFGLCLASVVLCQFMFRVLDTYDNFLLLTVGLVGCVTASFYGWLPLYLPELFPTRARATGQGISFNFGRIIAAFAALNTGRMVNEHFDGNYAQAGAVTSLVYLLGLALIWFAPETKGKPLPD